MIEIDITKDLIGVRGDMKLSFSFNIKEGEFIALSGVSGSGKTTLLRILAGLEECRGVIKVDGKSWLENARSIPPQEREIGFVFQDYALFSNMSVRENLLYVSKDESLLKRLLDITELTGLEERYPDTLSGGQQQRVALCRALMNRPKLLLMDEPLSALDPKMRIKLQHEIKTLHKEFNTTTIMVSHDKSEIYRLADRVVVLEDGFAKEVFLQSKTLDSLMFNSEVLNILENSKNCTLTLLIHQDIVDVTISKEEAETLSIGSIINISSSDLLLKY